MKPMQTQKIINHLKKHKSINPLECERWKDVSGYEGYYQASTLGNIRSIERFVKNKHGTLTKMLSKILRINNCSGYGMISLAKEGKNTNVLVHRIIARTFKDNLENKPCVNHIDGNKLNNCIDNLEWCTYSENELHSYRVLGKINSSCWTGKFGYDNYSSKEVIRYDRDDNEISRHGSATEASRYLKTVGFYLASQGRISSCARGETKKAYGFKWKYV